MVKFSLLSLVRILSLCHRCVLPICIPISNIFASLTYLYSNLIPKLCTLPGYKANLSTWSITHMDMVYDTFELFPVWFLFDFHDTLCDGSVYALKTVRMLSGLTSPLAEPFDTRKHHPISHVLLYW